jgi:hypothetical protein
VDRTTKPIHLTWHAEQQLERRGVTEEEIIEAIRMAEWKPAELGRLECRKNYRYGRRWNDVYYDTKQVRPIFVDEPQGIVVVTVYSYFL